MNNPTTCPACGQPCAPEDVFCQFCGKPIARATPAAETLQAKPPELPPTPEEPPPTRPKRRARNNRAIWLVGCAVLGLLAVLGVGLALAFPWLMQNNPFSTPDRIVLGVPNRSGLVDLYLLRLGQTLKQARSMAENITPASGVYLSYEVGAQSNSESIGSAPFAYGGFAPNANYVLFWQLDNNDVVLQRFDFNAREAIEILNTNAENLYGTSHGADLFLLEPIDQQQYRCYLSRAAEKAERLGKGVTCLRTETGRQMLIVERASDKLTATLVNTDNGRETVLLDDEQAIGVVRLSVDGSQIAYVRGDANDMAVRLMDTLTGEQIAKSQDWRSINRLLFAPSSNRFIYQATDDDGQQVLFISDDHQNPIATAANIVTPQFSPDGKQVIFIAVDEDGEQSLRVFSVGGTADTEVVTSEKIAFGQAPALNRLVLATQEDNETTLYSANYDGTNLMELYREDDVTIQFIAYTEGDSNLYMLVANPSYQLTLLAIPLNRAEPIVLVEEWAEIRLAGRAPSGRYLAFAGREDSPDDIALYTIEVKDSASPIELDDDADDILNILFARDGNSLIYTAATGSNPDDREVRQAPVNGREPYETLYEEAVLVDAQWRPGTSLQYLYLGFR